MTWVKLDDNFADHPAIAPLSDAAFRLQVTALCYCARYLTDGFIPAAFVDSHRRKAAAELVSCERWLVEGEGWRIHDYLDYQESRAKVEKRRTDAKIRANKRRSSTEPTAQFANSHTTPDPTRTTYIGSPAGRDPKPAEPNPSKRYALEDEQRRSREREYEPRADSEAFKAGATAARAALESSRG